MAKVKKLYRSKESKILAGVCGGIGEYVDIDPTVIRVLYVVFTILTGIIPFLIAYVILALVIPANPNDSEQNP